MEIGAWDGRLRAESGDNAGERSLRAQAPWSPAPHSPVGPANPPSGMREQLLTGVGCNHLSEFYFKLATKDLLP